MRLRSEIKPPQWYQSDSEYMPSDNRRLPRSASEKTRTRNYVEYNPHLPAAAFPTLDQPLPAGHHPPPLRRPENIAAAIPCEEGDHDLDSPGLDPFPHISPQSFDNFIASNGPQNPQYRKNMALLDKEHSSDIDISSDEDADGDIDREQPPGSDAMGDYQDEEQTLNDNPQWNKLPLGLRIEIAENMLEAHDLPKIRVLLGLNQCDIEELTRSLRKQNEDLEHENRVLGEMQSKQLKALMCLDNSDLRKHSVPARLIMSRKSWNRCHRAVQRNSRMRYLLCQAGDLLAARKFLSRRGLPITYAGEWDNQFVANPSVSNNEGVPEAFQWRLDTNPSTCSVGEMGDKKSGSEECPESSMDRQDDAQHAQSGNNRRDTYPLSSQEIQRNGPRPLPSRGEGGGNRSSPMELPRQSLVRLKIGVKNAAHIQANQQSVSHRHLMSARSIPQPRVREPNSDDTIEQSPPKLHRSVPIQGHFPLPVSRKLACWPTDKYHPQTPRLAPPPASGSRESLAHPIRPLGGVANEQIYGGFAQGSFSVFDKTPLSPDISSSEAIADENMNIASIFEDFSATETCSPSYSSAITNTVDKSQDFYSKMSAEVTFATPDSPGKVINNIQQSGKLADNYSSSAPNEESAPENMYHTIDVIAPMAKGNLRASTSTQVIPAEEPSEQGSKASTSKLPKECRFIGDESDRIILHELSGAASEPSTSAQGISLSGLEYQDETPQVSQKTKPIPSYQTDPSEQQEQPLINESDRKGPVVETWREEAISSQIPAHESGEPGASQVILENTKASQATNRKRGRPAKNRNSSNEPSPPRTKRSRKSDNIVVTQRVLRDRSATKNELKK